MGLKLLAILRNNINYGLPQIDEIYPSTAAAEGPRELV